MTNEAMIPASVHDARVSELLAANNREVERRRTAERALLKMQQAAGTALDLLTTDTGPVADFLASIHRHCASVLQSPPAGDGCAAHSPDAGKMAAEPPADLVERVAEILISAFKASEPDHPIAKYTTSYVATFSDMARAVIALFQPQMEAAEGHETQATVTAWQDTVFGPPHGPAAPLMRAINEMVEACISLGIERDQFLDRVNTEYDRQIAKGATVDPGNLPSEVAGVVTILYRVAQAAGFDLQQAVNAEMRKNRGRTAFSGGDGKVRPGREHDRAAGLGVSHD